MLFCRCNDITSKIFLYVGQLFVFVSFFVTFWTVSGYLQLRSFNDHLVPPTSLLQFDFTGICFFRCLNYRRNTFSSMLQIKPLACLNKAMPFSRSGYITFVTSKLELRYSENPKCLMFYISQIQLFSIRQMFWSF